MLKAIYKTGSQVILPNHQDLDYVAIFETRQQSAEALRHNSDYKNCWHFDSLDNIPKIYIGCYIYPFMELVEGQEIEAIKNFSIFEHETEYKECLRKYLDWLPHEHKWWYHIVIAYFMFKKGEMTLTEQEKEIAQRVHDNGIDNELYTYIIDYFKK